MNESEQAQAIAQIELAIKLRRGRVVNDEEFALKKMVIQLLEIVDSQAQKIADINRVGSNTLLALIEAQEKIADLTKELNKARRITEQYRGHDESDVLPWEKQ